ANPYQDNMERIDEKVKAGAEGLMLQPPLTEAAFRWMIELRERYPNLPLIVGFPLLRSTRDLSLWFFLIGKYWRPGAELKALKREFKSQERAGKEYFQHFLEGWRVETFRKIGEVLGK